MRRPIAIAGSLTFGIVLGAACTVREIDAPARDAGPSLDALVPESDTGAQQDASQTSRDATADATSDAQVDAGGSSDAGSDGTVNDAGGPLVDAKADVTLNTGPRCMMLGQRCASGQACCGDACGPPSGFPCNGPVHVWNCTGRGSCGAAQICQKQSIDALYFKSVCVDEATAGSGTYLCETNADCPFNYKCNKANGILSAGVFECEP
jgi:hypothetical protein